MVQFASAHKSPCGGRVGGKWRWRPDRHPTRKDVAFHRRADGSIEYATVMAVNSKARGVEALRKLPFRLPFRGRFLSPGYMLWFLTEVLDPVPEAERASTPLFRHPKSNEAITVTEVRNELRRAMTAVGLDASWYGAHSLRIGAATALALALALALPLLPTCPSSAPSFPDFLSFLLSLSVAPSPR